MGGRGRVLLAAKSGGGESGGRVSLFPFPQTPEASLPFGDVLFDSHAEVASGFVGLDHDLVAFLERDNRNGFAFVVDDANGLGIL